IEALQGGAPKGPTVRRIDISEAFADVPEPAHDERLAARPYFVMCGTREPRKNHLMMLNVWRDLAAHIDGVPKLLLVGGHGWGSELVMGMLTRSERLRGHVAHVETLGSPGLFRLMGQARALLAPSFAEGYGLPVEEALRLGAPVLAAANQAFHEITRGCADLIDPLDGPRWRDGILRLSAAPPPALDSQKALASHFIAAGGESGGILELLYEI
ncbi:MAG: glycosyltransferase, partial [Beijerinckiaceae bacterium]